MSLIFLILGVGMTAWVANDAARRQRQWFGWAALVWFTSVIGLAVWLVARRHSPVVGELPSRGRRALIGAMAITPLVLVSVVSSIVIVTFLLQFARNEGHAMEPALEDGERLIVNKLIYRLGEPRPGDVVMMYYPRDPTRAFVKRVVAAEGETLRIVDGTVYVNDNPLGEDYVSSQSRGEDDWGPDVVPMGHYFVLGDRRNSSSDSRHWGYVPKDHMIGKIVARFGGTRSWAWVDY